MGGESCGQGIVAANLSGAILSIATDGSTTGNSCCQDFYRPFFKGRCACNTGAKTPLSEATPTLSRFRVRLGSHTKVARRRYNAPQLIEADQASWRIASQWQRCLHQDCDTMLDSRGFCQCGSAGHALNPSQYPSPAPGKGHFEPSQAL